MIVELVSSTILTDNVIAISIQIKRNIMFSTYKSWLLHINFYQITLFELINNSEFITI